MVLNMQKMENTGGNLIFFLIASLFVVCVVFVGLQIANSFLHFTPTPISCNFKDYYNATCELTMQQAIICADKYNNGLWGAMITRNCPR